MHAKMTKGMAPADIDRLALEAVTVI